MNWISKLRGRGVGRNSESVPILSEVKKLSREETKMLRAALLESEEPIDVRQLMRLYSVEELCKTAEDYYSGVDDWSSLLAKPYICPNESPELLICFGHLLHGIKPIAGMDILEFGAGPGWASHALAQLGARMIVSDVSATALEIAKARFKNHPIGIPHTQPKFLQFDGRKFDLPNECVDRIVCIDAFHHVPNPEEIIQELSRILRSGGVAAFAEPGPKHSWSPGAQFEMKYHQVVENDIVIEDIWNYASKAGLGDLRLSIFGSNPFHVTINDFDDFLNGGRTADLCMMDIRHYMQTSRRLFFLSKGDTRPRDSRTSDGLQASIKLEDFPSRVSCGAKIRILVNAKNTGSVEWLPASQGLGSVWIGMHVHCFDDRPTQIGYFTSPLPLEATGGVMPGKSVEFEIEFRAMSQPGKYAVEFDLVAQQIAWFQTAGSPTVKRTIVVEN